MSIAATLPNFIIVQKSVAMKIPYRLEQALHKLYTAFHGNTLNPECCRHCAVGNICGNTDGWKHLSDTHGSLKLNYVGLVHQNLGRKFHGYSPEQLLKIEAEFLKGCGYSLPLTHKSMRPENPASKETLFKGLSAAVEYLCDLDKVKNIMDYSPLISDIKNNEKFSIGSFG